VFSVLAVLAGMPSGALGGPLDEGLRLAAEGRCAEASALLEEGPPEPSARRALGLCRLQLADFPSAAALLAELEPSDPALAVDLGIARFHTGDLAGAEQALARAAQRNDPRPELPLYSGLIALARAQPAAAAASFERARRSAPQSVEPAASYYAGVANAEAGERAAARAALERVVAGWPGTAWADEAQRALAVLTVSSPFFASLRTGFEHDSNAVLRGEGVELPEEIPSQADQRAVWRGVAGRSFSLASGGQLGAAIALSGSAHGDLSRFDALTPSASAWLDHPLGEHCTLRALAGYAHAWVNERAFLSSPGLALELHRAGAEGASTRVFAELAFDDYRFPSDEDFPERRDRDGLGFRLGVEQRFALSRERSHVWGALAYRRFTADGTEYSFDSPELELGFDAALPGALSLSGSARYAYRPYRHASTYTDPLFEERREHEWRTDLALERGLWRRLSLEARWRYQRNRSTAQVFDYSRHVVGLYVSWTRSPL
jgi:tetratricopeptide (TPR) repeat protein